MARSRRHTPIFAVTNAASEKQDKRHANRRLRRAVRQGQPDLRLRDVSNVWSFDKDGKNYWPECPPSACRK